MLRSAPATDEEKLDTLIHNLEAHHQAVKQDAPEISSTVCSILTFSRSSLLAYASKTLPPPAPPPPEDPDPRLRSQPQHDQHEALLASLNAPWNPNSVPANRLAEEPSRSRNRREGLFDGVSDALRMLVDYDANARRDLEEFEMARTKLREESQRKEDVRQTLAGLAEKMGKVGGGGGGGYDASRDPRRR